MNECECPAKVFSSNLSAAIDELQKLSDILTQSEQNKTLHHDIVKKKAIENQKINFTSKDVKYMCKNIVYCDLGYPNYYLSNSSFWSEKNNSCLNLEMDLVDQGTKIWRNDIVFKILIRESISCVSDVREMLQERLVDLKSDEKKLIEEFLEVSLKLKETCSRHMDNVDAITLKLIGIHNKMKIIHDESCKCKNKE